MYAYCCTSKPFIRKLSLFERHETRIRMISHDGDVGIYLVYTTGMYVPGIWRYTSSGAHTRIGILNIDQTTYILVHAGVKEPQTTPKASCGS